MKTITGSCRWQRVLKKKAFNSTTVLSQPSNIQSFLSLQILHIKLSGIIFHTATLKKLPNAPL
jgi:hypothetical protein